MNVKTIRLTSIAIFASLAYISFSFFQIKLMTPFGTTSFHLGNTFAVLGALVIGGKYGGIAAAIGMGIGDIMDPVYIIVAPKTILLKFLISYICGFIAHDIFKITKNTPSNIKIFIPIFFGLLFNVIAEPFISYFYSILVYGVTTDIAAKFMSLSFIVTLINASVSCVISFFLYKAIRPTLEKNNLLDLL